MKLKSSWYSHRLGVDVNVVRWGEYGTPLLIFPTAGGDAEEIERFLMIEALEGYLAEGRIKIYSCDSTAGQAMLGEEGSPEHRMYLLNQFQEFVYHELVRAIRNDCRSDDIGVVSSGSSIGAFMALAVLCRYPDVFTKAICMSGTYDILRFLKGAPTRDYHVSAPLSFVPEMNGRALELLRTRFVLMPSGEGRAEDIGESWRAAQVLGAQGIPNRVDSWGQEWHHDWPTWRHMLNRYIKELIPKE